MSEEIDSLKLQIETLLEVEYHLRNTLKENCAELERQMEYGVKQHAFAQEMLRQRNMLREALELLYDEATYSDNIHEYDEWGQRLNPHLVLPNKVEVKVREALKISNLHKEINLSDED